MNSFRKFLSDKPAYWLLAGLGIFGFAAAALGSSFWRSFNHDELEAIHAGWKIFSGEKIYLDFLQHHHFLFYYLLSGVAMLFGASVKTIIASRIIIFFMALGIGWLTYAIAKILYGRNIAWLSVFFLSSSVIFLQKVLEVRPDVPLVLCELLAIFFLLRFFLTKKMWQLMLSAIFLFGAFLFLQKAVFLIFLVGLLFLYKLYKKEINFKDFFIYWGMLLAFLLLFVWYVTLTFGFSEYVFLNWTINTQLLNTFPLYKYLLLSVAQNPLLWGLYIAGIVLVFKKRQFDMAAFFSLGLLGFIFTTKSPFMQYYLTSMPFIAMVAAVCAHKFFLWKKPLLLVLLGTSMLYSAYVLWDVSKSNQGQLDKINFVLSVTTPEDYVYDGDILFNVFRQDISYFWFSVKPKTSVLISYQSLRDYDYDVYQLIEEKKPKVISNYFLKTKNKIIQENYVQSEKYKDIYIRNN